MRIVRTVLWLPTLLLQALDIYTTSSVSVEWESNPLMASVWRANGFLVVVLIKALAVIGLGAFHALLVKYLPDFEKPFLVGLVASVFAMSLIVRFNLGV